MNKTKVGSDRRLASASARSLVWPLFVREDFCFQFGVGFALLSIVFLDLVVLFAPSATARGARGHMGLMEEKRRVNREAQQADISALAGFRTPAPHA